ncbi:Guanine nucleotide-binding protein alpha-1 subunit [Tritrichomonas foetus]|uniref:Guanine nucleotide-binding protein alpha-1 subunit n=1 Tax=Tritrichomonas foetus TaxID=1144522 RepID=A0A1J4J364_9EUKA|nr:Guanine nucleotide-binding protein alpha-1 subunit [Tritrichomonas foetus]|eukprot:OHS93185.1 Guanine nucleotide-binding protein alpha-1 subunit [Tritrichomonas foetus]
MLFDNDIGYFSASDKKMGCGPSEASSHGEKPKKTTQPEPKPVKPTSGTKDGEIPISSAEFEAQDIKILTLGAGECGKSTIWRQLKLIYCGGFSHDERSVMTQVVKVNLISDIKTLIEALQHSGQSVAGNLQNSIETVNGLKMTDEDLVPDIATEIKAIWEDPIMKITFQNANSIGLGDNAAFFLDNVERLASPNYLPTNEDLLKSRIRTTGISSLQFLINNKIKTELVDVGGQKCERAKWARCFQGVDYLLFVVSLSDFDQFMFEDDSIRRTQDSIDLFASIANSAIFGNKPIFLILNKKDVFEKKLKAHPEQFKETYKDFTGDTSNVEQCIEHVKQTFLNQLLSERDKSVAWVEAIPACAMDENSIRELFQTIAKKIVQTHNA